MSYLEQRYGIPRPTVRQPMSYYGGRAAYDHLTKCGELANEFSKHWLMSSSQSRQTKITELEVAFWALRNLMSNETIAENRQMKVHFANELVKVSADRIKQTLTIRPKTEVTERQRLDACRQQLLGHWGQACRELRPHILALQNEETQ